MQRQQRGSSTAPVKDPHNLRLADQVEQLSRVMERMNLADYLSLLQHPWRLIWVNFLAGAARGVGIAFGFAVLSALLLTLLKSALVANLPFIGEFIADVVRMVELHRGP